jgi:hypothetical protein
LLLAVSALRLPRGIALSGLSALLLVLEPCIGDLVLSTLPLESGRFGLASS